MGRSENMGWGPGQRLCEREGKEKDGSPGEETAGGRQREWGSRSEVPPGFWPLFLPFGLANN